MTGWKLKKIALPPSAKKAFEDNQKGVATPFNFSVKGQSLGVHNWTHGRTEKSNRYLSPQNAVTVLAAKLSDYQDVHRPSGVCDYVVLMVTADNIASFIDALTRVSAVLPDKTIKQALDYAKASKDLAQSKMIKTPRLSYPCFAAQADITPTPARELNAVMRNAQAANRQADDPFAALEALKRRAADKAQKNKQKLTALLSASADIYAFCDRGLPDAVALNLSAGVPHAGNGFTVLLCFIGENLNQLGDMLHEPD